MSEINRNEFVEVNREMCCEVENCKGTSKKDGKTYCRGCGNVQPQKTLGGIRK